MSAASYDYETKNAERLLRMLRQRVYSGVGKQSAITPRPAFLDKLVHEAVKRLCNVWLPADVFGRQPRDRFYYDGWDDLVQDLVDKFASVGFWKNAVSYDESECVVTKLVDGKEQKFNVLFNAKPTKSWVRFYLAPYSSKNVYRIKYIFEDVASIFVDDFGIWLRAKLFNQNKENKESEIAAFRHVMREFGELGVETVSVVATFVGSFTKLDEMLRNFVRNNSMVAHSPWEYVMDWMDGTPQGW